MPISEIKTKTYQTKFYVPQNHCAKTNDCNWNESIISIIINIQ